ncbi:cyclic nucleotide-binding domain-containing protein [Acinetobacter sp. ANC 4779]|uniref:cyclic nucleotide-binding domain-containing protein n=1 Tax=Acinetobacter sp. ANC 4779 TaxID=2529848 RepID=UPI00103F5631|nr:cyclic nucleotide-binding domain-containing protein [Acinetobacter sp. ANC 4779]TCB52402.1 cyclic nucleotide-binding domain-containing protein [Acinetobacter sp. ANC 4779]
MSSINPYAHSCRKITANFQGGCSLFSIQCTVTSDFNAAGEISTFLPQQHILRYQQKLDDVYVLLSGRMQIGWLLSEGEFKVSDYVNMYSVFNLVPFLQQKPLNFDFYAVEQVEVAIISGQVFLEQLQQ